MSDTQSVYEMLFAAASTDPKFQVKTSEESDQKYLIRLASVIGLLDDAPFESLPEACRNWYFECTENEDRKIDIKPPQGYPFSKSAEQVRRRPRIVTEAAPSVYEQLLVYAQKVNPEKAEKHSKESDQKYLSRLCHYFDEDAPAGILDWFQLADAAIDSGTAIPLPEGYPVAVSAPAPKAKAEPVAQEPAASAKVSAIDEYNRKLASGEVPLKRQRASTQAQQPKAPKPKIPSVRKGRTIRDDTATALIRDAVTEAFEHGGTVGTQDLMAMLAARGKDDMAESTVASIKASHAAALRTIQSRGWQPPSHSMASAAE